MNPTTMEFGEKIRILLRKRKKTQTQLAVAVGVKQQQMNEWINKNITPKDRGQLVAIARFLGVPADYLIDSEQGDPGDMDTEVVSKDEKRLIEKLREADTYDKRGIIDMICRMEPRDALDRLTLLRCGPSSRGPVAPEATASGPAVEDGDRKG